ncbi:hypothetical protein L211DRAFT_846092 [Terfezia boudieri ATCC MYA-4762]|uniref:Uncharacterized protein n=1 Tax=Terfezia boudieri ATCC MYA-4762 TaxID=1051890 RepID=A0A3N4M5S3_9PEZI|nr:hypothetical protein L211DRAFT_846092 [Terfezia boudieri ATCC MYA-4762]
MGKRKSSLARSTSKLKKKEKKREKEKMKQKLKQKSKEKGEMVDGPDRTYSTGCETIDVIATTAVESSSSTVVVDSKGKEAAAKAKPKAVSQRNYIICEIRSIILTTRKPAFAGPTESSMIWSSQAQTATIATNSPGRGPATEVKPRVVSKVSLITCQGVLLTITQPAVAGPAIPRVIPHKNSSKLGNIGEEDLQLRLTQSFDEAKLRSNSVPFITVTTCNENDTLDTRASSPTASIHSMEFSLKTRKQSYARRSMFHRFSSVSDGVWSVLETTANAARNTLKVPPMWEWKGTSPRKERLRKCAENKPVLHMEDDDDDDDDNFPYAGDWKTGARYRYYHRTELEGSGFVAVGRREDQVKVNTGTGNFPLGLAKTAPRRKTATNPSDKAGADGNIVPPTNVGPASDLLESIPKPASIEDEGGSQDELEHLLESYGGF